MRELFTDALTEQRGRRLLAHVTWPPSEAPTPHELRRARAALQSRPDPPPLGPPETDAVQALLAAHELESARGLEAFAGCGVRWLVDRMLRPRRTEPDPEAMRRGSLAHAALERVLDRLRERTGSAALGPASLPAALEALEGVMGELRATAGGVRARAGLRSLAADLERYLRHEAATGAGLEPERLEWSFGGEGDAHGPLPLPGAGLSVTGRVDRIDAGAGIAIVRDYKGKAAPPAARWAEDRQLQVALYALAARELLGLDVAGALYQPLGAPRRPSARRGARRRARPLRRRRPARPRGVRRGARRRPRGRGRRRARPARRADPRLPRIVHPPRLRPSRHLPRRRGGPGAGGRRGGGALGGARVSRAFTAEQQAAIADRSGSGLLAAAAGSGKTAVMVERFVEAVLHDGVAVGAILALTFTEKAAGELRERIRRRLIELGEDERAREVDAAWVGTIHGFCARVLRAQPLAAGLDPRFAVLDAAEARRVEEGAYERALDSWAAARGAAAVDLAAAYGPALRELILATHDTLRSRGATHPRVPVPPPREAPDPARLRAAREAAIACLADAGDGARVRAGLAALAACAEALELAGEAVPWPGALDPAELKGGAKALAHDACEAYRAAWAEHRAACADHHARAALALIDDLLERFAAAYAQDKAARAGLDFEDLELRVRDLLADAGGPHSLGRALRADHGRRVPGHEPPAARPAGGARAR